jgi:hypothetical protein
MLEEIYLVHLETNINILNINLYNSQFGCYIEICFANHIALLM